MFTDSISLSERPTPTINTPHCFVRAPTLRERAVGLQPPSQFENLTRPNSVLFGMSLRFANPDKLWFTQDSLVIQIRSLTAVTIHCAIMHHPISIDGTLCISCHPTQ